MATASISSIVIFNVGVLPQHANPVYMPVVYILDSRGGACWYMKVSVFMLMLNLPNTNTPVPLLLLEVETSSS